MTIGVTGRIIFMLIQAKVKTNQPIFNVEKAEVWTISVKSKPENNKANIEIINELKKQYKSVKIIKGLKSSKKIIEITI